jgi:hypothetical protein
MVLLQVNMPSGSNNFHVQLNESGTTATITFDWGKTMYDLESMFDKERNQQALHSYHPKMAAFEKALKRARNAREDTPTGSISVDLPVSVQTDPNLFQFRGKRRNDGTVVVEVEFRCFSESYNRKSTAVQFED